MKKKPEALEERLGYFMEFEPYPWVYLIRLGANAILFLARIAPLPAIQKELRCLQNADPCAS